MIWLEATAWSNGRKSLGKIVRSSAGGGVGWEILDSLRNETGKVIREEAFEALWSRKPQALEWETGINNAFLDREPPFTLVAIQSSQMHP